MAKWPETSLVELAKYGRVIVVVEVRVGWKVTSVVILGDVRKVQIKGKERETDCDFEEIETDSGTTDSEVEVTESDSEDGGTVTVT